MENVTSCFISYPRIVLQVLYVRSCVHYCFKIFSVTTSHILIIIRNTAYYPIIYVRTEGKWEQICCVYLCSIWGLRDGRYLLSSGQDTAWCSRSENHDMNEYSLLKKFKLLNVKSPTTKDINEWTNGLPIMTVISDCFNSPKVAACFSLFTKPSSGTAIKFVRNKY